MATQREIIRNLILYEYRLGHDVQAAFDNITRAHCRQIVSIRTVFYWYAKFRADNTDLHDQSREGRPREIDQDAVVAAIDLDPTMSTEALACESECSQRHIRRVLRTAGKKWRKGHWVPHSLTEAQKQNRVRIACFHLNRPRRRLFLNNIVTVDEKWVSFVNPYRENQWLSPGQQAIQTPRPDFRQQKAMLISFWNRDGLIHWDLLEHGHTVNAQVYCEQIELCRRALGRRRRPVILLHDNARPHFAHQTQEKLRKMKWEWLEHPAYSPDLSPSDYHLFRSLEHYLRHRQFANHEALRLELQTFFDSRDPEFWNRGIDLLPDKWQKVINSCGEYFD